MPLDQILQQCAEIQQLIAAAAEERPGATDAAAALAASLTRMRSAADILALAITNLQDEVRAEQMLTLQLAAAQEQEAGGRHASLHDALTGLPNRVLFNDRMEHALTQARRQDWSLALMFVDLNGFKEVNDQHGHDVGDGVLLAIAARLRNHTRSDDTICRHGGDEFLYLAVNIKTDANAALIAEKIIREIAAPLVITVGDVAHNLTIRASVGIAVFPRHGDDADELVRQADQAMYEAKRSGAPYVFAL